MRLLVIGLVGPFLACAGQDRSAPDGAAEGPQLVLVDSVALEESDTAYIARPTGFLRASDGTFFVTDDGTARLFHFSRTGRLLRLLGRRGTGPGEFTTPATIGIVRDSAVLVSDNNLLRLVTFDIRSGAPGIPLLQEGPVSSVAASGDTIWLGSRNVENRSAITRWTPRSRALDRILSFPASIAESPYMMERFWQLRVIAWPDTLLVGFIGAPELVLASTEGKVLTTVGVPTARRRGVAPDIGDRLTTLAANPPAQAKSFSVLQAMGRRERGGAILVYFDQDLRGQRFTATGFVTAVRPGFAEACVDAPLDLSQDSFARVTIQGDTVFTLEQAVTDANKPVTFVKAHLVSTESCVWEPTTIHPGAGVLP